MHLCVINVWTQARMHVLSAISVISSLALAVNHAYISARAGTNLCVLIRSRCYTTQHRYGPSSHSQTGLHWAEAAMASQMSMMGMPLLACVRLPTPIQALDRWLSKQQWIYLLHRQQLGNLAATHTSIARYTGDHSHHTTSRHPRTASRHPTVSPGP